MISRIRGFLVLGNMLFSSFVLSAEPVDYVFDPLDQRHVLYVPDDSARSPAILVLHASTDIEKVNIEHASNW